MCASVSTSNDIPRKYGPENRKCHETWLCTICDMTYCEATVWIDHIRDCHLESLKCEQCDYKCILLADIIQHIKNKHLLNAFQCSECGKTFYTKCDYQFHDCGDVSNYDPFSSGFYFDEDNGNLLGFN